MKSFILIVLFLALLGNTNFAFSQKVKSSFIVYGNCGMCKEKIDKAAMSLKGVIWADWNIETHELEVKYKSSVVTLKEIQQKIADAGYDNEGVRANDASYDKLHTCCKYERIK